jgi:hypothetical protein
MNTLRLIAIAGAAVAFTSSPIVAADGEKPKRPNMEEIDADKDGALSKEELATLPEKFRTRLLSADADGDGALSKEEWAKGKEEMQKRREEREKNKGGEQPK